MIDDQGSTHQMRSLDSPACQDLAKPDSAVFFDWTAADFLDSYPGFHLDSYLDAAIPGL